MDGISAPLPIIARRPAPRFSRRDTGALSISFEEEEENFTAGCALRERKGPDNDEKAAHESMTNMQNVASRSAAWRRNREEAGAMACVLLFDPSTWATFDCQLLRHWQLFAFKFRFLGK
jgi:hypothetical protein